MGINPPRSVRTPAPRQPGVIKFGQFPMGRWQVVWLGDVAFHHPLRLTSQPSVNVVIANLDSPELERQEIPIAVAQMFPLSVGRIWVDKILTDEVDPRIEIRELEIDTTKATECLAGIRVQDGRCFDFLLPFGSYNAHRQHTKSPCIVVELPDQLVVFPATELIRFYFGSSGQLLRSVFRSDFSLKSLVTDFEVKARGQLRIDLAQDIRAVSAPDIGRLVADKVALDAASLVSRSLVVAKASGQEQKVYARTALPFKGKSRMVLKGVTVKAIDDVPRFVVNEIVSCGFPFPFQYLEYISFTSKLSSSSMANKGTDGESSIQRINKRAVSAEAQIKSEDPKTSRAPATVVFDRSVRFPDLLKKPVSRGEAQLPGMVMVSTLPSLADQATGRGHSAGSAQAIEPTAASDVLSVVAGGLTCPVPNWQPYFDFLSALAQAPTVEAMSFVTLNPRQFRPHYADLPEMVDDEGVIMPTTVRMRLPGSPSSTITLARKVSFVNVKIQGRWIGMFSVSPSRLGEGEVVELWLGPPHAQENPLAALVCAENRLPNWRSLILKDSGAPANSLRSVLEQALDLCEPVADEGCS